MTILSKSSFTLGNRFRQTRSTKSPVPTVASGIRNPSITLSEVPPNWSASSNTFETIRVHCPLARERTKNESSHISHLFFAHKYSRRFRGRHTGWKPMLHCYPECGAMFENHSA